MNAYPVTTTYFPSCWCFNRSNDFNEIFAFFVPYEFTSFGMRPISSANILTSFGSWEREMTMSLKHKQFNKSFDEKWSFLHVKSYHRQRQYNYLGTGLTKFNGNNSRFHFIFVNRCTLLKYDWTVFFMSIATVIGPTPPGTGVMYPATCFAPSKSTSPHNFCDVMFVVGSVTAREI